MNEETETKPLQVVVQIKDILVGERLRKDYGDLSDLDTIAEVGLIQPIVLDRNSTGQYRLVAGGRRLAKLHELGLTEVVHGLSSVPGQAGFVYSTELPFDVRKEIELYENIGRKAMSWQERILSIAEIHNLKKRRASLNHETWGQAETGAELGVDYSYVSYALKVAERLRDRNDPMWHCSGLTEALRLLTEERMDEAKQQVAKLTAATIPQVSLNNSNEPQPTVAEALVEGTPITVPLSQMLRRGKMEDIIPTLPPESVDHIITDWPYAIDMDYLDQGRGMDISRVREEHDHVDNLTNYSKWLVSMYRLLKPKSFCVIFYDNIHWQTIYDLAQTAGFRVQRWPLVWVKTSPCLNQMASKNFTKATEFAVVLSKQNATLVKPQPTNYWVGPRASNTSNPFAKPKALWQWILSSFALQGDIICDPFCGECSSLLAAIDFGCRIIGMESNENHYNQGMLNIRNLYDQLTKSNVRFS